MLYRGFPSKLHHAVPDWVQPGALFHIRIGLDRTMQQATLITSPLAESLMESAKFYDRKKRWYISRTREAHEHDESMSLVIGAWKHYHRINMELCGRKVTLISDYEMTNAASN